MSHGSEQRLLHREHLCSLSSPQTQGVTDHSNSLPWTPVFAELSCVAGMLFLPTVFPESWAVGERKKEFKPFQGTLLPHTHPSSAERLSDGLSPTQTEGPQLGLNVPSCAGWLLLPDSSHHFRPHSWGYWRRRTVEILWKCTDRGRTKWF